MRYFTSVADSTTEMASGTVDLKKQATMVRTLIREWSKSDHGSKEEELQSILRDWLNKPKLEEEISMCQTRYDTIEEEVKTLETKKQELFDTMRATERTFQDKRHTSFRIRTEEQRIKWWEEDRAILRAMREATKPMEKEIEELEKQIEEKNLLCGEQLDLKFDLEEKLDETNKRIEYFMYFD
jgi:hypothetical protein